MLGSTRLKPNFLIYFMESGNNTSPNLARERMNSTERERKRIKLGGRYM